MNELEIKIKTLDQVKAMIKDHLLEIEHLTNRDNYLKMIERMIGIQTILCAVADMEFELKGGTKHDIR